MSDKKETNASRFSRWLSSHVSPGQISDFFLCYSEIEKHGYKIRLLKQPLLETTDLVLLSKLALEINHNKLFRFWHRKQINKMGLAMTLYISYVKETVAQKINYVVAETEKPVENEQEDFTDPVSINELEKAEEIVSEEPTELDNDNQPVVEETVYDENPSIIEQSHKDTANEPVEILNEQNSEENHASSTDNSETAEIALDNDSRPKEDITIRDAVVMVLNEDEVLLTAHQIYEKIVEAGLYEFGAKDPANVVRNEINRSCRDSNYTHKTNNIIFGAKVAEGGEREYFLLDRESELVKSTDETSDKIVDSPVSIEPPVESVKKSAFYEDTFPISDSLMLDDRLYIVLKRECDVNSYGATADYLANAVGVSVREVKEILANIDWATYQYGKYLLVEKDPDKEQEYRFFDPKSLSFSKPISATYFDEVISNAPTWRQLFVDVLKVLYEDYPQKIRSIAGIVYPSFAVPIVGTKEDAIHFLAPKEFTDDLFVELNRSANELVSALRKLLDVCNVDSENLVIKYERKQTKLNQSFKKTDVPETNNIPKSNVSPSVKTTNAQNINQENDSIRKSWKETLNHLSERYDVRLSYDYFSIPDHKRNDALFKVNNGEKDIIWVYYLHSSRNHYISIETEPEYLTNMKGKLIGFSQRILRESHPRQKMIFDNFGEIRCSLDDICDSIDFFFKNRESFSPYVRTKTDTKLSEKYPVLFKRIYTVMKDYGSIKVSANDVFEKVGKIARLTTVKRVLDYASWCEHIGSFYKYSATPIQYTLPNEQSDTQPFLDREKDFYRWLELSKKQSSADCSRFTSGLHVLSRFLKNECSVNIDLYSVEKSDMISDYANLIEKHPSFIALAENQRNRLVSSMKFYAEYLKTREEKDQKEITAAAKSKEKEFRQWVALRVGPKKASRYADILRFIERRCIDNELIDKPFFELDKPFDYSAVMECVRNKRFPFALQLINHNDAIDAISLYNAFLHRNDTAAKPTVLPKNTRVLDFKNIGDLAYTKPVRLQYFGKESSDFNSWADLYTKLIFMLRVDHPRIIADGTSLSGSVNPDISSDAESMRTPKTIGKNLFVETNLDTRGIINRIAEALKLCGISHNKVEIQYLVRNKTLVSGDSKKVTVDSQQMSKLMTMIKAEDDGISYKAIRNKLSGIKPGILKVMLDTKEIVLINEKYYHKDTIEDFDEAADTILTVIQNQFQREGGYTSAKMLYDELHIRLEDFFFDNGRFESQVELYDLTRYLFEKVKYKGNSYIFADNKHIWESEPDYPKSYLGLLYHWAKRQNGLMTRDEMFERLSSIGANSPQATFSWLMIADNQNPKEKVFLMYDEYRYVLTEACHIDEAFLAVLKQCMEELFDGDDYLSFDDIDSFFYTTLPELPNGAIWSPHMIKSILAFFDVGFISVPAGKDNDIKTVDAAIVRKNSVYKTFSDVIWSELNHDYELPKEFSSEEFRKILLNKGYIRGTEKMFTVHKTVEGDLRFFWTENNSKVTVSKK